MKYYVPYSGRLVVDGAGTSPRATTASLKWREPKEITILLENGESPEV